ncbi:serine hydrolase family protein [Candidatus Woesearchaeota archaeon]|nr:serine hydrolase family protein [Candidatus Woesearchaeota archaeon]
MNFIIIHGVYSNPEDNWFPWLKRQLEGQGYEVTVPKMPTPLDQSLESWLRVFSQFEGKISEETVLIGHSLGAAFILDYLEKTSKKIKAAMLVSGFHKPLGSQYDELNRTFVGKEFNWGKIRQSCSKFFVFAGDNDEYISLEVSNELAKNLNAELNIVHDGGHLNKKAGYDDFPILMETIMIEIE